jgi:hypothetical protein
MASSMRPTFRRVLPYWERPLRLQLGRQPERMRPFVWLERVLLAAEPVQHPAELEPRDRGSRLIRCQLAEPRKCVVGVTIARDVPGFGCPRLDAHVPWGPVVDRP